MPYLMTPPTTATACRMDALPASSYSPPGWTKRRARELWKRGFTLLRSDPVILALRDCEVRGMRAAYDALHQKRNYLMHICDQTIEEIAAEARYGPTKIKEFLKLLWRHGVILRIPRRTFDANYRPPRWRSYGIWRQASNIYEPATEGRWQEFAPPILDHAPPDDDGPEGEVEFRPGDHARDVSEGAPAIEDLRQEPSLPPPPETGESSAVRIRPLSPEVTIPTSILPQPELSTGQEEQKEALEEAAQTPEARPSIPVAAPEQQAEGRGLLAEARRRVTWGAQTAAAALGWDWGTSNLGAAAAERVRRKAAEDRAATAARMTEHARAAMAKRQE